MIETTPSPSSRPAGARPHDIVLFGATGFVGELTAAYLATHLPADARWAVAGRDRAKLDVLVAKLGTPGAAPAPQIVVADVADTASIDAMVRDTRVIATTVGPYLQCGEPVVAACAEHGTDYLDLCGEPEFLDRTYLRHQEAALASGARLVHACGFDSVPHDLGAWYTVRQLDATRPITVRGVVRAKGSPSGGTFHSGVGAMTRMKQAKRTAAERRAREGRPEGRRIRKLTRLERSRELGQWLVPMPLIDPVIVRRSAAADPTYGPDFSYGHYAGLKTTRMLVGVALALPVSAAALAFPPTRRALLRRIARGTGPSKERRDASWFTVTFLGDDGKTAVRTRVAGGDPGYDETAAMLAEAAMSLAYDENPDVAGQLTTATAMGQNLLDRLRATGITFELLASGPAGGSGGCC